MKKALFIVFALFCGIHGLIAQSAADSLFHGLITNASGRGIKAKVNVKGTDQHTVADKKGRFYLTHVNGTDTLVLRYKKEEIEVPVAGNRNLKIAWVDLQAVASEYQPSTVDDGYTRRSRRDYNSSSSGLSGEELLKRGLRDVKSALLACFPGVYEIAGEIVIRGITSINGSNEALILLDGRTISTSYLDSIDIRDVVSIEVQKGNNMYGVRGGKGVIIIRTIPE